MAHRLTEPAAPYAAHEVANQSPPLEGRNLFDDNLPLVEALAREGALQYGTPPAGADAVSIVERPTERAPTRPPGAYGRFFARSGGGPSIRGASIGAGVAAGLATTLEFGSK